MTLNSTILILLNVLLLMGFRSYFGSIERISQYNYEPSLEDISRASLESQDVKNVLIPRKSAGKRYHYRFIDTVDSDAGGSQWIYTSENVSLVVHVVDTAAYDVTCHDNASMNGVKQDLVLFQQICSSRWLAETPVLVLLSNTGEMTEKLRHSSIHHHFADFSGESTDIANVKSYFRNLFLRVDRKYKMRIWVEYVESGATAGIGKTVVGTIDKILTEESILRYGIP